MKTLLRLALFAMCISRSAIAAEAPPVAERKPVTEDFFGTPVVDEYRWMEDMQSPAFQDYMKGQAAYTRHVLDAIPGREALEQRIVALDNAGVIILGVQQHGDKYFYRRSVPGAPNYSLVMREGTQGAEHVLVDPDKLGIGVKHVSIDHFYPSSDGGYVAYGLSEGGSEQSVLHVMETATGRDLPETIDRTNYAEVSWRPDGKSFFYLRLAKLPAGAPETDKYKNAHNYLHVLGTDPEKDTAILGAGLDPAMPLDPIDFPLVGVTPGSDVAVAVLAHGVRREITLYTGLLSDIASGSAAHWIKVADGEKDDVTGFALHGRELYLQTHRGAPRFNVIETDALHPDLTTAKIVVLASDVVISDIAAAADALYVTDMDGGPGGLRRLPWKGSVERVALPYQGAVDGLTADPTKPGALFSIEGWIHARTWDRYDAAAKAIADTGIQPPSPVDTTPYASEEVRVKSDDGTMVPLSILRLKKMKLDGSNPTLIWGYGAYGISETPTFVPRWFPLIDHGGVFATCHVRGGGEYGEDWHKGGQKATKPNSWKDLIACGQYLIDKKYTTAAKLGIEGGSAGGILVGRAMTARPDLFQVVLDDVGVSNALRGEFSPNGPPNIPEFGSVKTADGFKGLLEMDALHHVKSGTAYPAVVLTTGINDPRVPSWESGKMAAALQAATSSGRPVLLRVDYDAGHGIGSTRVQRDHELADKLAFFFWQTGTAGFQP